MNLLSFNLSEIPATVSVLLEFIKANPILTGALFLSFALFYIYSFVHHRAVDSDVYEIDLISSGVSSVMVALLLIGLDDKVNIKSLDFSSPTTKVAIFLLIYATILIFFAFSKILPKFLVVILGNNELDLFINFVAVLLIEPSIKLTGTLLLVIGTPLIFLLIAQRIRRMMP